MNSSAQYRAQPIDPLQIEAEIWRLTQELENETDQFKVRAKEAAIADSDNKKAYAISYIAREKGSVEDKKTWASYETSEEYYHSKLTDALMKASRVRISSISTQLDSLRTLASSARIMGVG